MKPMTPEELRRLALAEGAELTIDGRPFNTERAQVVLPRAAAAPPAVPPSTPAPATAPPPEAPAESFSRADVEALLAKQELRLTQQFTSMLDTVRSMKENSVNGLVPEGFTPKYDSDGAITFVGVQYTRIQ